MIHVDRTPAPTVLIGDDSPAARERRRAEAFYTDPANDGKGFKFNVYSRREVKGALERLFHGKCAYCESKYLHGQPGDVEHFRPKGGYVVGDELQKPGYWWLAATWSNLLPSCIDCNRKRTQEFLDGVERGSGKENLFPILDEAHRAGAPGEEDREARLLLDPCRDHPEQLLEFVDKGAIKARAGLAPLDQKKAEASICAYGLDRRRLNEARRERQTSILGQYQSLLRHLKELQDTPGQDQAFRGLATALKSFQRFRQSDREYTLMARMIVDPVIDKIRPFLEARLPADLPTLPGASDDLLERFVAAFAEDQDLQHLDADLDDILSSSV